MLAAELVDLEAFGFNLDLTGFAAEEILALTASQEASNEREVRHQQTLRFIVDAEPRARAELWLGD